MASHYHPPHIEMQEMGAVVVAGAQELEDDPVPAVSTTPERAPGGEFSATPPGTPKDAVRDPTATPEVGSTVKSGLLVGGGGDSSGGGSGGGDDGLTQRSGGTATLTSTIVNLINSGADESNKIVNAAIAGQTSAIAVSSMVNTMRFIVALCVIYTIQDIGKTILNNAFALSGGRSRSPSRGNDADASAGYKGITCFVVPADAPGLSIGLREDKLGPDARPRTKILHIAAHNSKSAGVRLLGRGGVADRALAACVSLLPR